MLPFVQQGRQPGGGIWKGNFLEAVSLTYAGKSGVLSSFLSSWGEAEAESRKDGRGGSGGQGVRRLLLLSWVRTSCSCTIWPGSSCRLLGISFYREAEVNISTLLLSVTNAGNVMQEVRKHILACCLTFFSHFLWEIMTFIIAFRSSDLLLTFDLSSGTAFKKLNTGNKTAVSH